MHIIIGISGGVDSSVAAHLLQQQGHHVEGVFMKNWDDADDAFCPAAQDFVDAQAVCDKLGIPLQMVNFADEYWERVFAHFLAEYRAGRTPNPDILCNKEIKFRAFLDYARLRGADYIATGHYARRDHNYLFKGLDANKDQSYFLHALTEEQLSRSLFPVGEITKPQVRAIAAKLGLVTHAKKDSTGICFIGERKFKNFLNEYLPAQPGEIKTIDGETIGNHDGLMFYTIGQRQGLQIGGVKGKAEAPWFVVEKDLTRNLLLVAQGDHPALYKQSLLANSVHWINRPPVYPCELHAKIRYRQLDQRCQVESVSDNQVQVTFHNAQRAITPGQSIVFYEGERCLGGGIIN